MSKPFKPYPVEVTWIDPHSIGGSWHEPEQVTERSRPIGLVVRSVGLVTRKDEDGSLVITQSIGPEHYDHTLALPKCCIKKVRRLK